jgi:hypothetical protein
VTTIDRNCSVGDGLIPRDVHGHRFTILAARVVVAWLLPEGA